MYDSMTVGCQWEFLGMINLHCSYSKNVRNWQGKN